MIGASIALLVALFLCARNLRFLLLGDSAVGRVHTYAEFNPDNELPAYAPTVTFESKCTARVRL